MNELAKLRCRDGAGVFPESGKYLAAKCAYCGALLDVSPNRTGPRSYAESLGFRTGVLAEIPVHDQFTCPNQGIPEHRVLEAALER